MTTRSTYAQAVFHLRWLLDAVESWLETLPDGVPIHPSQLRTSDRIRLATRDEVAVAVTALREIGVLRTGPPMHLARHTLMETAGYRRGVREMLEVIPQQESLPQLCATLPLGLDSARETALRKEVLDLRAALFDLIASARTRLVLASPFWDQATAIELAMLFRRRLAAGVRIDVLGRTESATDNEYFALAKQFPLSPAIRFYTWYEQNKEDQFGTQTFHFKAAAIDHGDRAYLGTANMTSGGLRSRMELGVMLRGSAAATLAYILDEVLRIATPVEL